MTALRWWTNSTPLPGAPGAALCIVDRVSWLEAANEAAAAGGQLVTLWATAGPGNGVTVHAALLIAGRLLALALPLADRAHRYPGLQDVFPVAARLQRAACDLSGVRSDAADERPWLRHAAWPADLHPLSGESPAVRAADVEAVVDDYAFVQVSGDGVHEVAVGPVHAGIIEPGHFRFSVVGEKVLRLEERLGYVHKGIERRFTQLPLLEGHRLAARISGDSAVAFSWAYCRALEALCDAAVPDRALQLRALCLELERIQNHLGDLGALGNDAGFAFGLAQFSRLKEELLRAMQAAIGQRYLLDAVVPGGTSFDLDGAAARQLGARVAQIAGSVRQLRGIYDEHAGVRDRFAGAGCVDAALAQRLGLTGLAGRASAQALDLRVDNPWPPYAQLSTVRCVQSDGDVAARVAVRFDELQESSRLVEHLLSDLAAGAVRGEVAAPVAPALACGLIEGWRGPVLVALECGPAGSIRRCHPHDPSWQNWPALEHAIIGNILPDFPLINKSFNLSYSGHDL